MMEKQFNEKYRDKFWYKYQSFGICTKTYLKS